MGCQSPNGIQYVHMERNKRPNFSGYCIDAMDNSYDVLYKLQVICASVSLKERAFFWATSAALPDILLALHRLVKQEGEGQWSAIARHFPGRIGKQCRERWHNQLRPDIKREAWTDEEETILIEAHRRVGNKYVILPYLSEMNSNRCYRAQLRCRPCGCPPHVQGLWFHSLNTCDTGEVSYGVTSSCRASSARMICRWADIAKVIAGRTENAVKNHWNATLRRRDSDQACLSTTIRNLCCSLQRIGFILPAFAGKHPSQ